MLLANVSHGTDATDGTPVVVMLHGRGSHRGDLQALRPALPERWTLVTPQAPFPGHEWGYGPGWAWYRHIEADRLDMATLRHSLAELDAFLPALEEVLGYRPGPVALGGFSQGGTTSLAYGLTRLGSIRAVVNFSGFLPADLELPFLGLSPGVPAVFWAHGTRDDAVPYALAPVGRRRLEAAGVPVVTRDYDIGHWIVPDEVADAVAFMGAALADGKNGAR